MHLRPVYLALVAGLFFMAQDGNCRWRAGIGGYTEMMGHLQTSSSTRNGFFSPNLTLIVGKSFRESESWGFDPNITFTFLGSDDSHNASLIALNPEFVFRLTDSIDFRTGPGLLFRKVSGSGGSITLRNGTSGTITGFRPGSSETALIFTINIGFDFMLYEQIQSNINIYFQGVLGGAAFQANNFIGLSYLF